MSLPVEYKGTIEELGKKKVAFVSRKKMFFQQFYVSNMLHFWIIGHCDEEEANTF